MNSIIKAKKIWVLFGGHSSEREVSLRSGKGIVEALSGKGYEVKGYDVRPGLSFLSLDWKNPPDIVFIGLHGAFGEDGTIQGFLQTLGIPFVGSGVQASAMSLHKGLAKKQMLAWGIPMPFSYEICGSKGFTVLESSGSLDRDFFSKNWFIKPAREGSTIGIERFRGSEMDSRKSRETFLEMLKIAETFDTDLLIEEWVDGPELTVPVLDGKAFPVIEIRPLSKFYDYESKYTKGKTEYLCPAPLAEKDTLLCQKLAEKSFIALGCSDYGRVDMMLGKDGPKIIEMNTLPGMTETSLVPKSAAVVGLDYASFLEKLVNISYARQMKLLAEKNK